MKTVTKCIVLLAMSVLMLTGCKTSFNERWATETKFPSNDVPMIGAWDGTWTSSETGETGKIRAIVRRVDRNSYHALFCATYKETLDFEYPFYLYTSYESKQIVKFRGHANLGDDAGGMHYYEGDSTGSTFTINYKSTNDHGVFELARP